MRFDVIDDIPPLTCGVFVGFVYTRGDICTFLEYTLFKVLGGILS